MTAKGLGGIRGGKDFFPLFLVIGVEMQVSLKGSGSIVATNTVLDAFFHGYDGGR